MDKRFATFAVLVVALFLVNQVIYSFLAPPAPTPKAVAKAPKAPKSTKSDPQLQAKPDEGAKSEAAKPEAAQESSGEPPAGNAAVVGADEKTPAAPAQWRAIGSGDPTAAWRLLVITTSRGAAVERVELNSPRYRDLEDERGYLGYLAPGDAPQKGGAVVRVVGAGTPAAAAGLKLDDVITGFDQEKITSAMDLVEAMEKSAPGKTVEIGIQRGGAAEKLTAHLTRQPLGIIRPEADSKPVELVAPGNHDPLSFLMTIQQFDDRTLGDDNQELGGVNLRDAEWEVAAADQDSVSYRTVVPRLGLQIVKTYRVAKVPQEQLANAEYPAYNITLDVSITNVGDRSHEVAYRLDGPTGLPIEGAWYANKVSRTWSGAGLRDIAPRFEGGQVEQITPAQLVDPDFKDHWANSSLDYIAVDAQYFAAALIPFDGEAAAPARFADVRPVRVGEVPKEKTNTRLVNVSFRLDSEPVELAPGAAPLVHHFMIFTGPKRPALLAQYGPANATLKELLYYGSFAVRSVAVPLLEILHFFHGIVGNYGLAIIMLTVVVRGSMFPLSRKQALSAQKMAELQPEMKRINEKYKSEPDKRTKAQQDLFRQHKYNPMGGCLLGIVQLPVFVGLYRSLSVDVELRQAALFGDNVRWASNLAAPDMLWNWSAYMPDFVTHGTGMLALGPFLNIFPLMTIGLYIWQQKVMMPPPADEQAAMQQKMMKYMMVFMGVLFFKVASGLCLYFIASSLWGILERKFIPKAAAKGPAASTVGAIASTASAGNGNGAANKRRQRGRK